MCAYACSRVLSPVLRIALFILVFGAGHGLEQESWGETNTGTQIPAREEAASVPAAQPPQKEPLHAALHQRLRRLVSDGAVLVAENGQIVFRHGEGRYVPASTIKIATALAAMEILGADFRFVTYVRREEDVLYLKGFGDPLMVSDEWRRLVASIIAQGLTTLPLTTLALDDSAFSANPQIDGRSHSKNPYDAPPSALLANFNTLYLRVLPDGSVRSAESETPLLPLSREVGQQLNPGRHRVNLDAYSVSPLRLTGELALAVFAEQGTHFPGGWRRARMPKSLPHWVHHSSHSLPEIVQMMLQYSNNLLAHHLVLAVALHRRGEPAQMRQGMEVLQDWLRKTVGPAQAAHTQWVEGSGLSRHNRMDGETMLALLKAFYPWRELLPWHGPHPWQARAKTGTLRGVSSLAGYLPAGHGIQRSFVIFLHQPRQDRQRVFLSLRKYFASLPKGK